MNCTEFVILYSLQHCYSKRIEIRTKYSVQYEQLAKYICGIQNFYSEVETNQIITETLPKPCVSLSWSSLGAADKSIHLIDDKLEKSISVFHFVRFIEMIRCMHDVI